MKKNKKTILVIALIIAIGAAALIFIIQLRNRSPEDNAELDLGIPVETEKVIRDDFEIVYNYSGTAKYKDKTKISARISGEIEEIYVEEGEKVKAGQLLAKIDDRELVNKADSAQENIKEAETALKKAELSREISENNLAESKASLKEAESEYNQLENDYLRDKKLFEENAIAKTKFDQTKTQYQKAEARLQRIKTGVKSAEKGIEIAELDIENAESRLKKSRNELKNIQLQLDYTELRAPFNGRILNKFTERGEMIAAANPIFEAAETKKIEIISYIGMKDIAHLKQGSKALISYSGSSAVNIEAEITEISPISNPKTRTTEVKMDIENSSAQLKDGMAVSAEITAESREDVLIIPNKAIFEFEESPHVYIIKAGTAERRKIETGISDGHYTVVKSALNEDEIVAVSNINDLRDGAEVYLPDQQNGDD
ncbi:MAG: efflux RND transporter periplasmic adaptor subunit [Halanaerobium sp.]